MIYTLTLNPAVDRELTIPRIEFDTVLRASESRIDFGGKGFNVSRMLTSLNTPSTAIGFLGGKTGEILLDGLNSMGISTDFVWIPGETRTNISIVTESHDHYIKVNEKGPLIDPEKQWELLQKIDHLARPDDWWVLSGSLPPGMADSTMATILQILNRHQAQAVLDTAGEALRLGCQEQPFLIKPNANEASSLTGLATGTDEEVARAARAMRDMGAQNVIISLGKAGALLQSPAATWIARSPAVEEKNPTGAGDSMVGGLVWALAQGLPLQEALRWGVACGAATASLSGTEVGSLESIQHLLSEVCLELFREG